MSSWVSDVKNAAFQLESSGVPVIDKDIILALTEGLPDTFSMPTVALDSIPLHDLDLTNVITQHLNEEVQQRNDRIGRPGLSMMMNKCSLWLIRRGRLQGLFASTAKEGGTTSQTFYPHPWFRVMVSIYPFTWDGD